MKNKQLRLIYTKVSMEEEDALVLVEKNPSEKVIIEATNNLLLTKEMRPHTVTFKTWEGSGGALASSCFENGQRNQKCYPLCKLRFSNNRYNPDFSNPLKNLWT